ncbi:hypothetical protein JW948_10385 [bacterium]|nr:hypothetical protein [bacterium]
MKVRHGMALCLFMGLLTVLCPVWARTTGKIAGTVTDQQTVDPLAGANVVITGTSIGTAIYTAAEKKAISTSSGRAAVPDQPASTKGIISNACACMKEPCFCLLTISGRKKET